MKYSVRSMCSAADVSIVGNVAYLPMGGLNTVQVGKMSLGILNTKWFKEIEKKTNHRVPRGTTYPYGCLAIGKLMQDRNRFFPRSRAEDPFWHLRRENEPDWIQKLPIPLQQHVRCEFVQTGGLNPLVIVPGFQYMGFGYTVPDRGMIADAIKVFKLRRLAGVRQLGFLHHPVGKSRDRSTVGTMFEHTRYAHSFDVCAVANLIAENLGIQGSERNTLVTAALTHDALTPAGGDSIKLIDPDAFDEDVHYPSMLVGPEWEAYQEKYDINRELLIKTINGEGLLGRILDISDKSSYLARDTRAYIGDTYPRRIFNDTAYRTIASIVERDQLVCSMWQSAEVYKDKLVFGDIDRLGRFLTLRALMFSELYYNPYARFFEYLTGKGIAKYLYQKGLVTREELLREDDLWIANKINEVFGSPYFFGSLHNLDNTCIEEYRDYTSAKRELKKRYKDPSVFAIIDDFKAGTSTGTAKFSVRKGKQVVTFQEACPEIAADIESIMRTPQITRLYIFDVDVLRIPLKNRRKVKQIMRAVA